jgi:hypothetical protein
MQRASYRADAIGTNDKISDGFFSIFKLQLNASVT